MITETDESWDPLDVFSELRKGPKPKLSEASRKLRVVNIDEWNEEMETKLESAIMNGNEKQFTLVLRDYAARAGMNGANGVETAILKAMTIYHRLVREYWHCYFEEHP